MPILQYADYSVRHSGTVCSCGLWAFYVLCSSLPCHWSLCSAVDPSLRHGISASRVHRVLVPSSSCIIAIMPLVSCQVFCAVPGELLLMSLYLSRSILCLSGLVPRRLSCHATKSPLVQPKEKSFTLNHAGSRSSVSNKIRMTELRHLTNGTEHLHGVLE